MEYRIKKQSDFDNLFKNGKKLYSSSFILFYLKKDSIKIGYSISKKHGKAVKRNRIKRLLRSAFRNIKPMIKENVYIVILPRVLENYSYKVYLRDMKYVLEKEKLI